MTKADTQNKRKTPEQRRKLANLLGKGMPVGKAMVRAGWSEAQAAKGWKKVPAAVVTALSLPKSAKNLIALGKGTQAEDMRAMVHGRLIRNIASGTDKGAQSAKILGSSRDLNMWTPEQAMGLIILATPQSVIDNKDEMLKGEE